MNWNYLLTAAAAAVLQHMKHEAKLWMAFWGTGSTQR